MDADRDIKELLMLCFSDTPKANLPMRWALVGEVQKRDQKQCLPLSDAWNPISTLGVSIHLKKSHLAIDAISRG